jgi:hypothetical protein
MRTRHALALVFALSLVGVAARADIAPQNDGGTSSSSDAGSGSSGSKSSCATAGLFGAWALLPVAALRRRRAR